MSLVRLFREDAWQCGPPFEEDDDVIVDDEVLVSISFESDFSASVLCGRPTFRLTISFEDGVISFTETRNRNRNNNHAWISLSSIE